MKLENIFKNYTVVEKLFENKKSIILRALNTINNKKYIIKVLNIQFPKEEEISYFFYQNEIINNLYIEGLPEVYEELTSENYKAIVFQDKQGISLNKLEYSSLLFNQKLFIFEKVTEIIEKLHENKIIHKDINPSNIIYNEETSYVGLIDFENASKLSQEMVNTNKNLLEGTLDYISPEQTGRLNNSVDYRSDLYSLGATFYEIFSGQKLFPECNDILELVHFQVAKEPKELRDMNKDIPLVISNIMKKLLSKSADDRYQSAYGVKEDILNCIESIKKYKFIKDFEIAKKDRVSNFFISQRLYGRTDVLNELYKLYNHASLSGFETALISGEKGSGKSKISDELQKLVLKNKGVFNYGKFNKSDSTTPYGAHELFSAIIKNLLSEKHEVIEKTKNKILASIGENGRLLYDFIPELEFVLGNQPTVEILPPSETKNRLIFTFVEFLKVFMEENKPLVIFLDDCQFANEAALDIVKALVNQVDLRNCLLVLSYDSRHENPKFDIFIDFIKDNTKGNVTNITLNSLSASDIKNLILDSTNGKIINSESLAKIVFDNTRGVPLLVKEYLKLLFNKEILYFNYDSLTWNWNELKTKNIKLLNEEDLIKDLFDLCSPEEFELLKILSVFGEIFSYDLIEKIIYRDNNKLAKLLNELLYKGIIEFSNKTDKKFMLHNLFKFKSSTLFQIIEKEVDLDMKRRFHTLIGKTLLRTLEETQDESSIFDTLSHLNWIIDSSEEKEYLQKLADLNYLAATKARNNSSFKTALEYFEISFYLYSKLEFVPEMLFLNLCEMSYSSSEYEKMNKYFDEGSQKIRNKELRLKLIETKIHSLLSQGDAKGAVNFALKTLKILGISLPEKIEKKHLLKAILKIKFLLIGKNVKTLADAPLMTDNHWLGVMRVLSAASVSSYLVSPDHFMLIVIKQLELSLKYGNAPQTSFAYTTYGVVLCGALDDLKGCHNFGTEALKLLNKIKSNEYAGRTTVCAHLFNLHWKAPIMNSYKELNKAYDISMKSGDMEFASWALLCRDFHGFFMSKTLKTLKEDLITSTARIKYELKQESQYYTSNSFLALVESLNGYENTESIKKEKELQERFEKEGYKNGLYYNYSNAMIKNLIFGNYVEAYNLGKKADKYVDSVISTINFPEFYFYSSISLLLGDLNPSGDDLVLLRKKIKALKKWGNFCPSNHLYKYKFLNILYKLLILGKNIPFKVYDDIIKSCLKEGFIADAALINEIVALIAEKSGNETLSNLYMTNAHDLYTRWGAFGKIEKLNEKYSHVRTGTTTISNSMKNGVSSLLDSSSLIKLSTLLTAENQYDKLVSKLTEIIMENAGAQKGLFIGKRNNDLFVETEFNINDNNITQVSENIDNYNKKLAKTLVNYVCRTGELFLLEENSRNEFKEEYLLTNNIKSLLILPVMAQNKIMGAFYLENNLTADVFTSQRIETLKLISLQGAIAIENIRIYSTLEEKVKERTTELKLANERLEEQKQEAEKAKNIADEATRIKSEFLANMSHEIRTPMNGVMGLTYLLRKTNLNERQVDYLSKIEDSAKHLLNVINDILDFSKVEAGKIELENRTFRLENIFNNISNIFAKPIEDKGLELIQYIDPKIPFFLIGDDVRLKQTLINIIGNAVKFTHKGEILIKVQLSKIVNNRATILFSVKDTGIGLSPEQKNRLFKSFTQADGSITRKYGGTGLGLAISKNFVELMGGHIGVDSELDHGSNFYFEISFEIGEASKKADLYSLKGLKTLIVDDSETSLEILKSYMENYGCFVDTCSSGKDAIDLLESSKNEPYKLLLIDWKMPEMDGLETISHIKNNEALPEIPLIIMVSAFNIDEIKEEGSKLSIDGYLTKPVQQSSLLDTVLLSLGVNSDSLKESLENTNLDHLDGNVLLVEDNPINQIVAKEILESFGLNVYLANNGFEALSFVAKDKFDLIFMDIQMPGIDGYETTKKIKELNISTPIVAMTANVLQSDVQKCIDSGMEDYIGKPIDPEKLHKIIEKWTKKSNFPSLTLENSLPEFQGINIHTGLRRAMGKVSVYTKVLKIFLNEFSSAQDKINQMIEDNDKASLLKYLHTLKGAAGNISAEVLYEKTSILESKSKNWEFDASDLDIFFKELSIVLSNKDKLLNEDLSRKKELLTYDVLKELIDDFTLLANELKSSSFNSEAIFESIENKLNDYNLDELSHIKSAITNFDYDSSLTLLTEYLANKKLLMN